MTWILSPSARRSGHQWLSASLLCLLALLCRPTPAAAEGPAGVHDHAELFSSDAARRAGEVIRQVRAVHGRHVLIETYPSLDGMPRGVANADARNEFCTQWMIRRGQALGVRGMMVLVCMDPPHVQVYVGSTTKALFSQGDREELLKGLIPALKARRFDDALDKAAGFISDRMGRNDPAGDQELGPLTRATEAWSASSSP